MAPFTLKSLSPSRKSLQIPSPNTTSPLPSLSPSPSHPSPTPSSQTSYFPSPNRPLPAQVCKDEAFKTVRAMEEVMSAWNEYRIALGNMGKAGRKFAGALKALVGGMDKTEVPAQTIRPTAALLDGIADVTIKMARKIEKEYEEANSDASKYFSLLAKESRSHEAYMGAILKKHDKAEKAYRKASKNLSDTSSAHSGLLNLKDTLSADITKAQYEHTSYIGSKQSTLLLHFASSTGSLSETLMSYFSEGLRKSGTTHRDIEHFRVLADIHWQGAIPNGLEEEADEKRREELRLIKARVGLGELDVVGDKVWAGMISRSPEPPHTSSATNRISPANISADTAIKSSEKSSGTVIPNSAPRVAFPANATHRPAMPQTQSEDPSKASSSEKASPQTAPVAHSSQTQTVQQHVNGQAMYPGETTRQDDATTRPTRDHRNHSSYENELPPSEHTNHMTYAPSRCTAPIHPPAPKRTVSQIAAEMNAHRDREMTFEAHQSHEGFVRGCRLYDMDYDRMMQAQAQPPRPNAGSRRVTMPPVYTHTPPSQPERPAYRQTGYGYEDPHEFVLPKMVHNSSRRVSYHEERGRVTTTECSVDGPRVRPCAELDRSG